MNYFLSAAHKLLNVTHHESKSIEIKNNVILYFEFGNQRVKMQLAVFNHFRQIAVKTKV